ncbi:hypothetical protein X742_32475 [Mesorhizobium sp. LNHC232B00]|nr:hypothetical protein X742_32475 [Mesorhizobium sp. LNHC232B00]
MVATLAKMYVQGVSTRKVRAITKELCGHAFSASSISAINKRLDESLTAFGERPLHEPFPYLILDACYEKVREAGIVTSQAVLIAVGIDWDGRLCIGIAGIGSDGADGEPRRLHRGINPLDDHLPFVDLARGHGEIQNHAAQIIYDGMTAEGRPSLSMSMICNFTTPAEVL